MTIPSLVKETKTFVKRETSYNKIVIQYSYRNGQIDTRPLITKIIDKGEVYFELELDHKNTLRLRSDELDFFRDVLKDIYENEL